MRTRLWICGLLVGLVLMGTFTVGFVGWVARERAVHREMALAQAFRAEAVSADKARRVAEALAAKAQADASKPAPASATGSELDRLRAENSALRARVRELEAKPGVSGDRPGPAPAAGSPATSPSR